MHDDSPAVRSVNLERHPVAILMLVNLNARRANLLARNSNHGLNVLAIGGVDSNVAVIGVRADLGPPRNAVLFSPLVGSGGKRERQQERKYVSSSFRHTPPPLHLTRVLRKRK